MTEERQVAPASTREQILEHALAAFNERGIEAVGMRDLARDLGLSPGNLTYHFATKEAIVVALAERLRERNDEVHRSSEAPDGLAAFIDGFRPLFRNQWEFRGLTLAAVHLRDHFPAVDSRHDDRQRRRIDSFRRKLHHLMRHGSLSPGLGRDDIDRLIATISLIGRFWISEYRLDRSDAPLEATIDHYLAVLGGSLQGAATAKGRDEIRRYLSELRRNG